MNAKANIRWHDNSVQFPRLLAEIRALGLHEDDKAALCESMDIDGAELEELFIRAEKIWEDSKAELAKPDPLNEEDTAPMLQIEYRCPDCGHEWSDQWTSAVDSDCPKCGAKDITALEWEEIQG